MPGINMAGTGQALDVSFNTIISEFKLLEQERGAVKATATHFTLTPGSGPNKNVLNYRKLSAYNVAEGVDITQAQALGDDLSSYTPSEVAVQVIISDRTVARVADRALMAQIGRMMSNAYELKEDSDGVSQFASFTPTLGGTTTIATAGHIRAAAAVLRLGASTANPEPAPKPWYGVWHPNTMVAFEGTLIPLTTTTTTTLPSTVGVQGVAPAGGASPMAESILLGKGAGNLAGITHIANANIAVSSTPSAVSGIYSKEGFIYVSEKDPGDERERDASLRAWELNIVGSYIFGVYRSGAFGIAATFDSTTPTS